MIWSDFWSVINFLLLLLHRRSASPWNLNKGCFCQSDVGAVYGPTSRGPCDGVTRWPFVSCNVSVSTQIISCWQWLNFHIVTALVCVCVCIWGECSSQREIVGGTTPVKPATSHPLHLYFSGWEAFLGLHVNGLFVVRDPLDGVFPGCCATIQLSERPWWLLESWWKIRV